MQYFDADVDIGLQAGFARFASEYPAAQLASIQHFVNQDGRALFRDVAGTWPDPCEPRFVKLAAEILAVAVAVRKHQAEPNFTHDDARCAIGFLSWLLNSFKHR